MPPRKTKTNSDAESLAGAPGSEPSADAPKMLYYNAGGKRVKEGDASAVRQFLSDDPNRPDASKEEREDSGAMRRLDPEQKATELIYYNAEGERVKEPVSGGRQFSPDDPNRPDAPQSERSSVSLSEYRRPAAEQAEDGVPGADDEEPANDEPEDEAEEASAEAKAQSEPAENKARKSSANK